MFCWLEDRLAVPREFSSGPTAPPTSPPPLINSFHSRSRVTQIPTAVIVNQGKDSLVLSVVVNLF